MNSSTTSAASRSATASTIDGHDPRSIEVGDERPAHLQHALDRVEPVAPLVVEPGRAERRRERPGDHLGERDLGRADRPFGRPLEVDDAEQLVAVDDRRRDLAADVGPRGAVVGVGEDVGDELRLSRRGGPADDPDADLDLVERVCSRPRRPSTGARRSIGRYIETSVISNSRAMSSMTAWMTVDTGCEPSNRAVIRLSVSSASRRSRRCGGELRRTPLGLRRHAQDAGHPGRCDEDDDRPDDELVTELALEADRPA